MSVPSNLIPVTITGLPTYGGVDSSGWVPYVIGGVTYKAQLSQMTYLGVVTSVNASGGTTGFSFSGGPITTTGTLTLEGTLAIANGGTGSTTAALARAALLPTYAGNANKALRVNAGATDVEWVLDGGGTVTSVAQTFTGGLISVGGSPITGSGTLALTVAGTSGGIPYFSSAAAWASSAVLAANALMVGGGAGAAPATVTTGTGVLTALAINVGSAGAFVAFNGALGTPSSGTLTNCTGYPVSGLAGLGTGVAAALAINIGSAGAPVLFNGAGGTPSSMTATNLSGTATALNIGGNAATATAATNLAGGAAGSTPYQSGAGATAFLAAGSSGQIFQSGGAGAPSWSTATYPATAGTSGNVLTSDGTNWSSTAPVSAAVSTRQVLLSGSSATYTTPANVRQIKVTIVAGGGGGGSSGTSGAAAGTTGGTSTFNSVNAVGGTGGTIRQGGIGGTGGTGSASYRIAGQGGGPPSQNDLGATSVGTGGMGGGAGAGTGADQSAGTAGIANTGGGGGGGGIGVTTVGTFQLGGGGGGGETAELLINTPAATYTYTVGAGGAGATAGTGGQAGGAGGSGYIIVEEFY